MSFLPNNRSYVLTAPSAATCFESIISTKSHPPHVANPFYDEHCSNNFDNVGGSSFERQDGGVFRTATLDIREEYVGWICGEKEVPCPGTIIPAEDGVAVSSYEVPD